MLSFLITLTKLHAVHLSFPAAIFVCIRRRDLRNESKIFFYCAENKIHFSLWVFTKITGCSYCGNTDDSLCDSNHDKNYDDNSRKESYFLYNAAAFRSKHHLKRTHGKQSRTGRESKENLKGGEDSRTRSKTPPTGHWQQLDMPTNK